MRLNGDRPLLLSSNPAEDNSVLSFDLANPDTVAADGSVLHRELIYINRRQFIWQRAYCELLLVRNFDVSRHVVAIGLCVCGRFRRYLRGARATTARERGQSSAELLSADTVALRYRGLDGGRARHHLALRAGARRSSIPAGALFVLKLGPGEWQRLALRVDLRRRRRRELGRAAILPGAACGAPTQLQALARACGQRRRLERAASTSWRDAPSPISTC